RAVGRRDLRSAHSSARGTAGGRPSPQTVSQTPSPKPRRALRVDAYPVLAALLRHIEGAIGPLQQLSARHVLVRHSQPDADGHTHVTPRLVRPAILLDAAADPFGDSRRARRHAAWHDDNEFIAPESRAHIEHADGSTQDLGNVLQERVAGEVAVRVV